MLLLANCRWSAPERWKDLNCEESLQWIQNAPAQYTEMTLGVLVPGDRYLHLLCRITLTAQEVVVYSYTMKEGKVSIHHCCGVKVCGWVSEVADRTDVRMSGGT